MSRARTQFVEELRRRYDNSLQRFLRGRTPPDEVADLVNECYLRMLVIKDPLCVQEPEAFLMRTARNLAVDRSRRRALEVTSNDLPAPPDELPGAAASPEEDARAAQLGGELEMALGELPERTATVFRLRRLKGYSSAAIAAELGLGQRAVQKHLADAVVFLEQRLRPFLQES